MDTQHLYDRLQQLHEELQRTKSVDEKERRALQQLMADIQDLQEKGEEDAIQKYHRLSERLKDNVALLEASHPTVTMLMSQVVDTLAKMGI